MFLLRTYQKEGALSTSLYYFNISRFDAILPILVATYELRIIMTTYTCDCARNTRKRAMDIARPVKSHCPLFVNRCGCNYSQPTSTQAGNLSRVSAAHYDGVREVCACVAFTGSGHGLSIMLPIASERPTRRGGARFFRKPLEAANF